MFQEKRGEGHLARINQKVLTYLSLIKKKRKRNKEFCLCINAGWAGKKKPKTILVELIKASSLHENATKRLDVVLPFVSLISFK